MRLLIYAGILTLSVATCALAITPAERRCLRQAFRDYKESKKECRQVKFGECGACCPYVDSCIPPGGNYGPDPALCNHCVEIGECNECGTMR